MRNGEAVYQTKETLGAEQLAIVHAVVVLTERWLLREPGWPQVAFNDSARPILIAELGDVSARSWLALSPDSERLLAFVAEHEPRCTTLHMLVALELLGMVPPLEGVAG